VQECCQRAHDRCWPHQVHVGTNNLANSSPMPLEALARKYPRQKLVLIHCWPFLEESGHLAKTHANIYLDTCWLPVLNPGYYRQAMEGWINYVPAHKMMCSQDSTSVEMAAGSSLVARQILSDLCRVQASVWNTPETVLREHTAAWLHSNAVTVYGGT
jgi:predicted TIM-barrel fold metal-dependent hydrolase